MSDPKASGGGSPKLNLGAPEGVLERFFAPGGILNRALGKDGHVHYEDRPQQLAMALEVQRAIDRQAHLMVEAGTGTGKSYAYLVPFILWATSQNKRVLIATHTKALQQQLVERDLPFLQEHFRAMLGMEVRYALCVGSGNYICPRRLQRSESSLLNSRDEVHELELVRKFASKTRTGRNLDMPFEPSPAVWSQVNREADLCLGRKCELFNQSFFFLARKEQEKAHILIANHHLLFADVAAGGPAEGGVLAPFDALVIDEAHQAEDVACQYLGREIVNLGLARLLEQLHSRRHQRSVLHGCPTPGLAPLQGRLAEAVEETREVVGRFFTNLLVALDTPPDQPATIRIRRPRIIENILDEPLLRLETILQEAVTACQRDQQDAWEQELQGYTGRVATLRADAMTLLEQQENDWVFWASVQPRAADGRFQVRVPRVALTGAPVDIAPALRRMLFDNLGPIVMTSATLSSGGSFRYLRGRLGLREGEGQYPISTMSLDSPFDFRSNAMLYVARDLPDPRTKETYEEAARQRTLDILRHTHGRAFVLCTSFRMVDSTADLLSRTLPKSIKVLKHGSGPRTRLLDEFRRDTYSVLVGTSSFWQGVDVPGEALSCVVMMKLPFAMPGEPLVEARLESIARRGDDPFSEYSVPQAVMLFRQGFGRLIRTRDDCGIVAILDPRAMSRGYGEIFLESLPTCRVSDDLQELAQFARERLPAVKRK